MHHPHVDVIAAAGAAATVIGISGGGASVCTGLRLLILLVIFDAVDHEVDKVVLAAASFPPQADCPLDGVRQESADLGRRWSEERVS